MNTKVIIFIILVVFGYSSADGKIKMVFRYDDYTLIPSQFDDSLINIFQKNNIPLCLGIIAFDSNNLFINRLNPGKINDLRSRIQRKEIEIALHGYNHSNHIIQSFLVRDTYSEFATIDFDKQYEEISKGKRALDTFLYINTNIFIPPFNTYDKNTLIVLEDLDFEIISASMSGVSSASKIKYIPGTYGNFSELPEIINNSKGDDVTIIFFFHKYSFEEGKSIYSNNLSNLISINQLDTLLRWIKKQNVSFYTFSDLAKTTNFDRELFQANSIDYNLFKKILNKLKLYQYGVYSTNKYRIQQLGFLFGNIFIHLISFLLVYFFVTFFIKILRPGLNIVILFLIFLAVLIFLYLFHSKLDNSYWMKFTILILNFFAIVLGILREYKSRFQLLRKRFHGGKQ